MGFSEIALREIKDKNALEFFTKIEESSKILLSIVNDVLDTSKIQAGEINLENRPFSPSAVAQKVIDMLIVKATDKSITINRNFTSNFDLHVEGDDNRFKQIIINLLNNAIKFTHNGSISISGDSYDIDDKFRTLTLIIKDTGIGINKEDQKNLFIPFAQATSTKTREYGGTGLGLAIVKQLCSLMGGNITLRSQPDKGSTFTVTITLPKIEKKSDFLSPKLNKLKDSNYKEIKVLVVEDNKVNQFIVSKQLDFKGITCDFANDGLMALSYLKTKTPDLILMDLQMPNMDGFTASNLIKKNRALQNIPIVIISASVSNEDKEKASLLGINDFINKPFYQDDLLAVIDKYLKPKIDNSHLN
jgi:CheY-like chemotaxis protein/anti-sigma regulatory factor (Ser/Thr protein kinase)